MHFVMVVLYIFKFAAKKFLTEGMLTVDPGEGQKEESGELEDPVQVEVETVEPQFFSTVIETIEQLEAIGEAFNPTF
jgi:hypothetical protein